MGLHIFWPGWVKTLCGADDFRTWKFYDVEAQFNLYFKEKRIEDFDRLYCSKCLKSFKRLVSISKEARRRERNKEWEQVINQSNTEDKISLGIFEAVRLENMPKKYERYRWIKTNEKQHDIEDIILHPLTTELYHEASQSCINGQFLATILSVGSAIDQFIRQLVDPKYQYKKRIPNKIFTDAVKHGFITKDLNEEIKEFKKTIRDHVAHPKSRTTSTLGFEYIEETIEEDGETKEYTYWGTKDKKPIQIGPIPSAKKGLKLFWRLVKYFYRDRDSK